MMVNGSERDQYLEAMGIRQWFPRKSLVGAKASPVPITASTVSVPEKQLEDELVPKLKEKKQLLDKQDLQAFTKAVNTQLKSTEPARVKPSIPPKFRLQGLLFPSQCLVINDATAEFDSARQAEPMRLLKGLFSALAMPSMGSPIESSFNWPLVRSNHIDQGVEVAKDAALAFVKKQLTGHDIRVLILMGENPQQFIFPQYIAANGANTLEGCQVVVTKSLIDMLSSPLCKRQVWSDLQCLQLS